MANGTHTHEAEVEQVIIGCGGAKLDHAAPARDLYTGQAFRLNLAAALALVDGDDGRVAILSAKHGIVQLDEIIEPYDVTVGDAEAITPRELRRSLAFRCVSGFRTALLLANAYAELFEAAHLDDWDQRGMAIEATANLFVGSKGIGDQRGRASSARKGETTPADAMAAYETTPRDPRPYEQLVRAA